MIKKNQNKRIKSEKGSKKMMLLTIILIIGAMFIISACQPIIKGEQQNNNSNRKDVKKVLEDNSPAETNTQTENKYPTLEEQEKKESIVEEDSEKTSKENEKDKEEYAKKKILVIESVEGNLVKINLKAEDPDGDPLTYYYTPPFNDKGEWQTEIGDAGEYQVTVTVSDGKVNVSKEVLVIIRPANKPPVLSCKSPITVKEGETVIIDCDVSDPDGDDVILGYSGWITSREYQTNYNDSGRHEVTVVAADETHKVNQTVIVNVLNVNRPPVINDDFPTKIVVKEGAEIHIDTSRITDPDNDPLRITYSEPFNSTGDWQTREGDAGIYLVEVTISDGEAEITKQVNVEVKVKNRPPVFIIDDDE